MIGLLLAAALQAAAPAATADPLAPARVGDLQCYAADPVRKTCRALAAYTFGSDGRILNQAEVMISTSPLLTMRTVSPVTVRDGAVCGEQSDIDQAQIFFRGRRIGEGDAASIRTQLRAARSALEGQEICSTYRRSGDWWIAQVTVGGVARPDLQDTVMWVPASAGYTVQP